MRGASADQIASTPFKRIWKNGFLRRERKIIIKALRLLLATLDDDTQKWRDIRTMLACMGEDHIASRHEIEVEIRERTRLELEKEYAE